MPDDQDDGAPPNGTAADLTAGTAIVRIPRSEP
ncbi:hypothetical protein [Streptomyces sp. NPDC090056]